MIKLNLKEMANFYIQENLKRIVKGIDFIQNRRTESKTARFGTNLNYTEFEEDGTLKFVGDASVWKDINIGGVSLVKGASNQPTLAVINSTSILTYHFGVSKTNEAHGSFELQHDYKEGTDLFPHLHWYPIDSNSGDVLWLIDYYIGEDKTAPVTGTVEIVSSTDTYAWEEIVAVLPKIDGASMKMGSQCHFRIYRDPLDSRDTYGSAAAIATFGIHYEIDTVGSRKVFTK